MKALRITCFLAAAYYVFHSGIMLFTFAMTTFSHQAMPADEISNNPFFDMQYASAVVARDFAPWMLIGVGLCLILGSFTRRLWKIIPVIAVLLFVGGIAWAVAYYQAMQPYYEAIAKMMPELPGSMGRYVKNSMSAGQSAGLYPVLVPGFVIFVFWWKSRSEVPKREIY